MNATREDLVMGMDSRDVGIAILDRLDRIVNLLATAADMPALSAAYFAENQRMLRILIASMVPASPQLTRQVVVGVAQTALVVNESQVLRSVRITNLDPAQPLWVSGPGVSVAAGEVILPNQTGQFVVPTHESLWGICAVATIPIGVSVLHDVYSIIESLGGTEWMTRQS